MAIEDIYTKELDINERPTFENFKSHVCHDVKNRGDIDFIINIIQSNMIQEYFDRKWYPEAFYLLGMLDYISRINGVPMCTTYDVIRQYTLAKPLYPQGILLMEAICKNSHAIERAEREAIPEFRRFNIIESDIKNVA